MKIKPLNDWVVIIPAEAKEKTSAGLYIPDTAKSKPSEGVVQAAGPGAYEQEKRWEKKPEKKERKFIATSVKPGDRVMFEQYAGQKYVLDDKEYMLVRERDILGIMS